MNTAPSVWHLLTPEFPPRTGGVADYVRSVAQGLAEAGDEVHVWCPSDGRPGSGDRFVVHPDLGDLDGADLDRMGARLDGFSHPRRLVVQWVPHGYGRRSMNLPFCLWLWRRAKNGDVIDLMVHEPYLAFWEGTWRQSAAAVVHRLMTMILLRAATRVWVSIPSWERAWRPYALGRSIPFRWLPIPSSLAEPDSALVRAVRTRVASDGQVLLGHFGTYGAAVSDLLVQVLPVILGQPGAPRVLLIGSGSERFLERFARDYPRHASSIHATGSLSSADVSAHVAACDFLLQPYPDGISCRRTTAMAGLRLGVPIVTTRGRLTEPLWEESRAVTLSDAADARALARQVEHLLERPEERKRLSQSGRDLYDRRFALRHTVAALRMPDLTPRNAEA
jgi:glycosyltransferase involved in cell wall biosynthesis